MTDNLSKLYALYSIDLNQYKIYNNVASIVMTSLQQ
jgi:hypothetical protein